MENKYSLAILPPESILVLIKSMKEQLATDIGWFNSKNSLGHITICEFWANDRAIEKIKNHIRKLCDALTTKQVHLNNFNSFPNGAFFIAPNDESKKDLITIMNQIHQSLRIPNMAKSYHPHLSIARKLSLENVAKANQMFTTIDLNFVCNSVILRKFDDSLKQFSVTDTFEFGNNPQPELIQGTLF